MTAFKKIVKNEKYMDDIYLSIFDNLIKKVQKREESLIWRTDNTLLNGINTCDFVQTSRNKMFENVLREENKSLLKKQKINGYLKEDLCQTVLPSNDQNNRRLPASTRNKMSHEGEETNLLTEEHNFENKVYRSFPKEIAIEKKNTSPHKSAKSDDFSPDCKDRAFKNREQTSVNTKVVHDRGYSKKIVTERKVNIIPYERKKSVEFTTDCKATALTKEKEFQNWCERRKQDFKSSDPGHLSTNNHSSPDHHISLNNISTKKRHRSKSKSSDERNTQQEVISVNSKRCLRSGNELQKKKSEIKLCVKITEERTEKCQEFMIDLRDLPRIKKTFPKISEIIPDVDSGRKNVEYSADAMNIILRFVLFRRFNSDVPNATTAVEVLAAIKDLEISEAQAYNFGLNEICDVCKEKASGKITYKKKHKMCFITISSYAEPIEFSIPFHPVKQDFSISFERHITNIIRFQAISGCFAIIGIQIQLNDDHVANCNNKGMLKIDYSTKNVTEDLDVCTGRVEKPLRPINIIHFKKHLFVNSNQIAEITLETETKPYLCSSSGENIEIKKREKDAEFNLAIISDFKIPKSGKKLFIVGKLFYHVQKSVED